jgi:shikimate dehydrogenase
LVALLGHPVAHSLSPVFQNAAFRASGLHWRYVAFDVEPSSLADAVRGARALGLMGLNCTVPHKLAVIPLLDGLDASAARMGAVNTVAWEGARLIGHNTDAAGFGRALRLETRLDVRGIKAVVVGAGGAARAVVASLAEGGCRELVVWGRRPAAAAELAREAAVWGVPKTSAPAELPLPGADLYVQCTPMGMSAAAGTAEYAAALASFDALLPRQLSSDAVFSDIIYRPAHTPFLEAGAARGGVLHGGLGMLLWQGALAFELWTGRAAPVDAMQQALKGLG